MRAVLGGKRLKVSLKSEEQQSGSEGDHVRSAGL